MKHNGLTLCCSWRWTTAAADLPRPVSFFRLRRDLIFFHCSGHYSLLFFWLICFYFSSFVGHNSMWIPKAQIFFHSTLLWCIFSRIEIFNFFPCTESELVFCFVCLYYCCFVFKFCSLLCSPSQLCRWLKEVFLSADKSGDGLLSVDEVFSLMHKLNVKISNRKLRETFKVCVCVYFSLSFYQMTWYFSESIVCIFGCGLPRIFWMLDCVIFDHCQYSLNYDHVRTPVNKRLIVWQL